MKPRFPYGKTFLLGFGFFGISLIWPIFNNYVPIFLRDNFALPAGVIGFIMTWDNYLNMFVQPVVGERSDQTRTRLGRRKPWMLAGAPLAALFFILVPAMRSVEGIMFAILLTNISMALFRAPTVALLGDLFPSQQRSTANGIINLMGGLVLSWHSWWAAHCTHWGVLRLLCSAASSCWLRSPWCCFSCGNRM